MMSSRLFSDDTIALKLNEISKIEFYRAEEKQNENKKQKQKRKRKYLAMARTRNK